jgi:predicted nucleic acid-binding protein
MKKGLIIADSGPIFSLALIDKLDLLDTLFDDVTISHAVWIETRLIGLNVNIINDER